MLLHPFKRGNHGGEYQTKKTNRKKDNSPKGLPPALKGPYFFTAEDDPTTRQDHYLKKLEVIGRFRHIKGDESQYLTKFFDQGRLPIMPMPH